MRNELSSMLERLVAPTVVIVVVRVVLLVPDVDLAVVDLVDADLVS